jgi:hypothetical protein
MLFPLYARIKLKTAIARSQNEMSQIVNAIHHYESTYSTFPSTRQAMSASSSLPVPEDFTYGTDGLAPLKTPNPTLTFNVASTTGNHQANNAEIMAVLLDLESYGNGSPTVNKDHLKNPQRIVVLPVKFPGNTNGPGVGLDGVYRDPFGNPYFITLDLNNDGKCRDSFYRLGKVSQLNNQSGFNGLVNTKDPAGRGDNFEYNGPIMVWSAGPDGTVDPNARANEGANKDNLLSWK